MENETTQDIRIPQYGAVGWHDFIYNDRNVSTQFQSNDRDVYMNCLFVNNKSDFFSY